MTVDLLYGRGTLAARLPDELHTGQESHLPPDC